MRHFFRKKFWFRIAMICLTFFIFQSCSKHEKIIMGGPTKDFQISTTDKGYIFLFSKSNIGNNLNGQIVHIEIADTTSMKILSSISGKFIHITKNIFELETNQTLKIIPLNSRLGFFIGIGGLSNQDVGCGGSCPNKFEKTGTLDDSLICCCRCDE